MVEGAYLAGWSTFGWASTRFSMVLARVPLFTRSLPTSCYAFSRSSRGHQSVALLLDAGGSL